MNNGEPYTLAIDSKMEFLPGGNEGGVFACLPNHRYAFKALRAERIAGIDYGAFKICSLWVAQTPQWVDHTKDPVPAEELFAMDVPMVILYGPPSGITIQLINTSDKPQRFAVNLVGEILR